jgi:hypothetical protein
MLVTSSFREYSSNRIVDRSCGSPLDQYGGVCLRFLLFVTDVDELGLCSLPSFSAAMDDCCKPGAPDATNCGQFYTRLFLLHLVRDEKVVQRQPLR